MLPSIVFVDFNSFIKLVFYESNPIYISLFTIMFEWITESCVPRDMFPPLWSLKNAPIDWFLVMKFSTNFGCDDCSHIMPLFLFDDMKFFLI